jgi:hypothetical protein
MQQKQPLLPLVQAEPAVMLCKPQALISHLTEEQQLLLPPLQLVMLLLLAAQMLTRPGSCSLPHSPPV